MRVGRLCAVLIAAVIVSGCGSTAARDGAGQVSDAGLALPRSGIDGGDAAALSPVSSAPVEEVAVVESGDTHAAAPDATVAVDPSGVEAGQGVQQEPAVQSESGAARARGGRSAAPVPGTPPRATVEGPGVTKDAVKIGLFRNLNVEAAAAAAGVVVGDFDGYKQALIDDLNARGGIGGREVIPVWHEVDATAEESDATRAQAMCTAFTQDNAVFGVLSFQLPVDVYVECFERAGVSTVVASLSHADQRTFERFPHYFEVQTVNLTRLAHLKVAELHAQGFFPPGARIGLVRYDTPRYRRAVAESLQPALAARGLRLHEEFALPWPENFGQRFNQRAAVSNAVLQFKAAGVDRVIFLAWGAGIPVQFMTAAEQQDYRPRYGVDTQDEPMNLENLVLAEQLRGAVGFGWGPLVDVNPGADPGPNSARRRCLEVLAARGHRPPDRDNESAATAVCDFVWFFEAAATRAPTLTAEGFRLGAESLDSAFTAAGTERTRFGRGRHDGAAAYRRLAFSDDCRCFRYDGPLLAAP